MIFRKQDYTETEPREETAELINAVKEFCLRIAPEESLDKIEKIAQNMTVIYCVDGTMHKARHNGDLKDIRLAAAAHKFWTDVDAKNYSANQGLALRNGASTHVISHETLHAFSSDIGKTENGGFIKTGTRYAEYDNKGNVLVDHGLDMNESITDALASRFQQKIGPNPGASYSAQVIMADLLMGENVEDNAFIHDVYFGKSEKFAEDFDKTLKTTKINFQRYLEGFKITERPEDTQKADELLRGAVEYNLRKTNSPEELDKVYDFQKKVINLYKNGGFNTGFIEDDEIKRLDNLLGFADKMKTQCAHNLMVKSAMNHKKTVRE